jgi:hypothetical protein
MFRGVCTGADLAGGMAWMIVMVRKSPVERRDGDAVLWFVEGPGLLCGFFKSAQAATEPPYSAMISPEPPNSAGKSLSFGSPSRMGSTVSA